MSDFSGFSWYHGNLDWLPRRTIFLTKGGSYAYGTSTSESDTDLRGIAIAPIEYYLGFLKSFEQAEVREPLDVIIYDIRKYARLAAAGNPNILELLFTEPSDWIIPSGPNFERSWEQLYKIRNSFLSRRVAKTFSGYAVSQLYKLRTGRANGNRGPARQELILKYGFDTKNALHLVRLLKSGLELLQTGKLAVKRTDAEQLLDIRYGKWSLDKIEDFAEKSLAVFEEAVKVSPLPLLPDEQLINNTIINIIENFVDL